MRTVRLSGELGRKFGRVHKFDIKTPAEAIRALCANFPEFEMELRESHKKNVGYKVFNGRYQLEHIEEIKDPATKEIRIVPVVMGSNATTRIFIGVALIAVGVVTQQPWIISAGVGLTLGGVVELLSPVPKIKEPEERPENKPSYLFNGPVNTTAQGHPVPIGYGRLRVGGGLISAGISIDQIMAGYKRVRIDKTTTRQYTMGTDGKLYLAPFQAAEPDKIYRKELLNFTQDGYTNIDGTKYDLYEYKLYYYEIVLELVEV